MTQLSQQQLTQYASQAGFRGTSLATIVAIAMAESSGNTTATNSIGNNAGTDRGVLQLNSYWHNEVSDTCAFDPLCSFQQAYRISNAGTSFSQWTTFGNDAYKKYLGDVTATPSPSFVPTSSNPLDTINNLISTLNPAWDWIKNPNRILKMLFGIIFVALALYIYISPEASQMAYKFYKGAMAGI